MFKIRSFKKNYSRKTKSQFVLQLEEDWISPFDFYYKLPAIYSTVRFLIEIKMPFFFFNFKRNSFKWNCCTVVRACFILFLPFWLSAVSVCEFIVCVWVCLLKDILLFVFVYLFFSSIIEFFFSYNCIKNLFLPPDKKNRWRNITVNTLQWTELLHFKSWFIYFSLKIKFVLLIGFNSVSVVFNLKELWRLWLCQQ